MRHKPVLLQEVLQGLALKPGEVVVDGTLGSAGHALAMLEQIGPTGRLIGLDQDPASIERCRERLKAYPNVDLVQTNFLEIDTALSHLNVSQVDAVLLDIGFSSDQMEDPERGFSFERPGPLDMRMNPAAEITACDLIHELSQEELEKLFRDFGEGRWARRFAEAILEKRKTEPIETTTQLAKILTESLPKAFQAEKGHRPSWARRHPVTKVFQALRVVVNQELQVLEKSIPKVWKYLKKDGRFGIISFQSLEDRIIKQAFRNYKISKEAEFITRKAVQAEYEEIKENPRARSARLRIIKKLV